MARICNGASTDWVGAGDVRINITTWLVLATLCPMSDQDRPKWPPGGKGEGGGQMAWPAVAACTVASKYLYPGILETLDMGWL